MPWRGDPTFRAVMAVARSPQSDLRVLTGLANEGYDVFLTGEPEEPSLQTARELGIHFVAAGHDATERLGVQALSQRLSEHFDLDWEFIGIENPV